MLSDYLVALRDQNERQAAAIAKLIELDQRNVTEELPQLIELVRNIRAQCDGMTNNLIKFADEFVQREVRQQVRAAAGMAQYTPAHGDLMHLV